MNQTRVLSALRHRACLRLLSGGTAVLAMTALVAAQPASAATSSWKTRVFSISYDGSGELNYSAQGANGDSGCFMQVAEGARYSFDNLWTVRIGFKKTSSGRYDTRIESITHVSGPQAEGKHGASHLKGKQTEMPEENCADGTILNNVGTFDCTSSTVTLTAFPDPQMEISREKADLVLKGRAFLDGRWKYTGSDSIPSDQKKGCATYQDDLTYGSDLIPGIYATSKVSLPARELFGFAKHKGVTVDVDFGKHTEFPRQSTCESVFGKPHVCIIHSQSLTAKFKLLRVR